MARTKLAIVGNVALLFAAIASAQEAPSPAQKAPTPEALQAEIEALKAAQGRLARDCLEELLARRAQGVAREEQAGLALGLHRPAHRRRPLLSVRRRRP